MSPKLPWKAQFDSLLSVALVLFDESSVIVGGNKISWLIVRGSSVLMS